MDLQKQIEDLIEKMRSSMPSFGTWPFTVIILDRHEISDLRVGNFALSSKQILLLTRTDFDRTDLLNYITNTREFFHIPASQHEHYLNCYTERVMHKSGIAKWSEKIANISLGLMIGHSENMNLCIEIIDNELSEIDSHFHLTERNLKAFQLFDVYAC